MHSLPYRIDSARQALNTCTVQYRKVAENAAEATHDHRVDFSTLSLPVSAICAYVHAAEYIICLTLVGSALSQAQ
jgi:hypothetical protein